MLDGMGKIPDLVAKAKADGQTALALTDHGVMHGVVEFFEECEKQGLKALIGVEIYLAPRTLKDKTPRIDASPYHLILIAKNEEGYKNLLKLTTIAHLEGYYYKPRVDKTTLKKHSAGLVALSACLQGEIPRKAQEDLAKARAAIKEYLEIFPNGDFYLEVQKHPSIREQDPVNELIFKLAEEFKIKVVATCDIHYVNPDDNIAQDALLCLQTGRIMSDTNRLSMKEDDYSLKTTEAMKANFPNHPEVITNTLEVAQKCHFRLKLGGMILPVFPVPSDYTIDSYFLEKAYLGLNWRYGNKKITKDDLKDKKITGEVLKIPENVWERAKYELEVISKMAYQGYFLIVSDYVQWAKDRGIAVGPGRGSAAGSIIAYSINITNLDPLKFNLLFERFLNPDRISMPDVDMDFADSRRDEVINYVCNKYGRDHVAQIITFGTMAARMAVRDVGRVLGMTYSEVDLIAKLIPFGMNLAESLENITELKDLYASNAQVKECLNIAKKLEGVARHASVHAAGVVISKEKLTEYVPLQKAAKGDISVVTQYSMNPIEHLGLLKMDFLGLSNLTIIQNALRIIRKTREVDIDIDSLPLDDPESYKILARAETIGIFQLESEGMRRYLKELKPNVFEDIIAMVALYRPGPMQWIDSFIARKHGREKIDYVHPLAKDALENTYGIIVYQEQLMQLSKDMAGFTGGQADTLRKAMGKKIKDLMEKIGKEFRDGCVKNGISEKIAHNLYQAMQDFAQYAFNKSHAACYAMIAYQTAYLKAHYPSEFMASLMTSNQGDLDKLAIDISECERMEIKVLPPSVNESFVEFGVVKETNNIRFGLSAVKNVGAAVAEEIVEERSKNGIYPNLKSFIMRLGSKVINKKSLESLIMAGALDDLGERAELLYNLERILAFATTFQKNQVSGQNSLFGDSVEVAIGDIEMEKTKPANRRQRLAWERELLGMYVSEHPLSGIAHLIEPNRNKKLNEISDDLEGEFVRLAGIITTIQKILTRSNQNMVFAKLEDLTGNIEVLAFPKILEANLDLWRTDKIVAVDGYVSFKDGAPKILAEAIYEISDTKNAPAFESRAKRKRAFGNGDGSDQMMEGRLPTIDDQQQSSGHSSSVVRRQPAPLAGESSAVITITIPKGSDKTILSEIKEILLKHPGKACVTLKVPDNGSSYKEIKIKTKIERNPVLLRQLKDLVGKENVV
jgi:DNA polymerase-3 subunit alpha